MLGGTTIVKFTPLLARPPTVTTTLPVVAPAGTGTAMLVALQLAWAAVVPLNVTALVPCEVPKFAPAIVTDDCGSELRNFAGNERSEEHTSELQSHLNLV